MFQLKESGMVRQFVIGAAVFTLLTGVASAQVAMLTQVAGDVKVAAKGAAPRAAVPFLKLNEGETLTLAGGARVQMVYLASGRQEIWKGAGPVAIGGKESTSASLKPETSQVPAVILKQLAKTPVVGQTGKTGMVMLRSMDDLEALDQLETDYKEFRKTAAADDTTPEVFFLTGLLEYKDFERADKVLAELKGKPAYQAVVEHFAPLVAEAKKPRG
jgi:hypothetical protein